MKKTLWCVLMIVAFLSFSCSPTWNTYSDSMFQGKRLLREGEYAEARNNFLKAAQAQNWSAAYAFAATASYKMGDLASAESYIMEAERLDAQHFSYVRVLGYKGLVLLKQGKESQGLDALTQYIQVLRSISSPTGARQIEVMIKRQPIDLPGLEKLIDEQVSQYESDIQQYLGTGTGFYDRPGTFRPLRSITP